MKIGESGIYRIRNLINNKFYIGSAVNLNKRKNQHFHYLRNNTHHNKPLQNSFNKYSEKNFIFEVMCYCYNEDLITNEQFYIDKYKPQYNICKIAGSSLGRKTTEETIIKMKISHSKRNCKHSEETKFKMSLSHKGKVISLQQKEDIRKSLSIPILQFDKEGKFIKEYSSTKEAFDKTNIFNITAVLKGYRKYAGSYKWTYKN